MRNGPVSNGPGFDRSPQFRPPHFALRILALLLAACASPAPQPQDPVPATVGVRPGDVITVKVWREPDYTGEWSVDARGRVVLPVLGEIAVQGRSAESLSGTLEAAYRRYLNNPPIEINVLRRIPVQGEVGKPGLYPADATVSVGELIALAGGVTQLGDRHKIQLLRNNQIIISSLGPSMVLQRSPV